jgi:hypothetical protein
MKNIDLEIFLLCRPKNLIVSKQYTYLKNFLDMTYPLSMTFGVGLDSTKKVANIKATDVPSLFWIRNIQESVYEAIKNKI